MTKGQLFTCNFLSLLVPTWGAIPLKTPLYCLLDSHNDPNL